jgi:hypothetical protein
LAEGEASQEKGNEVKLSIAYVTSRATPRWDLFIESFLAQTTPEQRKDIEVMFIDGKLWSAFGGSNETGQIQLTHPFYHDPKRRYDLEMVVNKRFRFLHIPPKPCLMQGPFRKTNRDFFCASNTRNTAIIAARGDYLVCVDDLSVLMPGWIAQVMHAAGDGYAVCGAYKKVMKLDLWPDGDGFRVDYEEFAGGRDSRWDRGSDTGIVPWSGGGLFGCSFGARVDDMLAVDGSEEACNGGGGEDTDFGIRLERYGVKFFYNRNMLTLESEEGHHDGAILPRERRMVKREHLPEAYDAWDVHNQDEKYWSDHVLYNRLRFETGRYRTLIPNNLREARSVFLATGMVSIPSGPLTDWRDGGLLKDL